jgi:hypothetical protein
VERHSHRHGVSERLAQLFQQEKDVLEQVN